ncbi:NAD-glutamate dehydrogenase domain-containing protein [Hoyosella subflava]|uniref:NAD-specific glutamate dehydrogenase n=1 Tax=Hoyosella subflava (strain DSM 45089 / JCM 17490 / NBRC 109087 / DQS3-9A1) TaxID=443218 RepID=F6EKY4_HOYSD|nr:NAD-glutamate dehydrogenase domain-containing protein [Hoyosella subflava]AEF41464.1 NAD-specific glutamate dehydrogenase [Hoyosella subflava DQS3-9A1]
MGLEHGQTPERGHGQVAETAADAAADSRQHLLSSVDLGPREPEELAERARIAGKAVVSWSADDTSTTCVVGWPGKRPRLVEVLPLFEHLGLELADHRPGSGRDPVGDIFTFQELVAPDIAEILPLLGEAFLLAWERSVDRDDFSMLVRTARLRARQVQLLRAVFQYLRLAHIGASRAYVRNILVANPAFVRHWIELFEARFDPSRPEVPEDQLGKYVEAAVTRDEFRVLQWYAGVAAAIVRTSYFRTDGQGRPSETIVLKLDPSRLPFPSGPAVRVETFVHHPDVGGLHIRCGAAARGGLRWSDRIEDYRDEVIALAGAQQVKNSLIVPAGAKGAFVVKVPLAGLEAAAATIQVQRCYRLFVRGLLDITDNLVDGAVNHPPDTVVLDDSDPYLVVAADKGTAQFSDLANAEAQETGFWLDDGFASGGSSGFDHKGLGVTARGAWVAVRRHFAELGIDPAQDEFTVVGIGDMSGDVFGNGMLLSDRIRLVAAFDHRHIFVDPDPDPRLSFAERVRLAGVPASSWDDYNADLISPGGGVFARSARTVRLSPQARQRLGVDEGEFSPDEVVQAILRAPTDLLWNGGVGTFVRASNESDSQVSDRSNNRVRITASELRCRVIGEGGNLGLTQAARVEYALQGGCINADFIDNAAGVNTSDREVNLKILLGSAVSAGLIDRAERDHLLRTCAAHVVEQVLRDNEEQTWAISVAEAYGPTLLDRHEQVMTDLAESGLDPIREHLPDTAEIAARRAAGRGLTRPEIAVLLAYAKNAVHALLLKSSLPDADSVHNTLVEYFPEPVSGRFAEQIRTHRLARDIVATRLSSDVINRVGPGFLYRVEDQTGAPTEQVVRAFLIIRDLFGLEELWRGLRNYPVAATIPALHALERVLEYNVCWLTRRHSKLADPEHECRLLERAVHQLRDTVPVQHGAESDSVLERCLAELAVLGAPAELTTRCRVVSQLQPALALAAAADEYGFDVTELANHHKLVSAQLRLSWLTESMASHPADTHWTQLAKAALYDQLISVSVTIAIDVLRSGGLSQWTARNAAALERARSSYAGLATTANADIAMLTVGVQALRDLRHATGVLR